MRHMRASFLSFVLLGLPSLPLNAQPIRPGSEHLFVKAKLLINPGSGTTLEQPVIELYGGKILRVGTEKEIPIPAGAKVMDCGDKFVIPGLVDTHGHLYSRLTRAWTTTDTRIPRFYLAAGVTSVGSPGSMDHGGDMALKRRIDTGQVPGPRFFMAGGYIEMAPARLGWMNITLTTSEARLKVDMWASEGASAIKIYAGAKGDVLQAAIDQAHNHGMRVWAHVGEVSFQQAMDMGIDQLFHGVDVMSDSRAPGISQLDWAKWAKETLKLDLARPEITEMFRTASERKVVLTPTAVTIEMIEPNSATKHYLAEQKRFFTSSGWAAIQKYQHPQSNAQSPDGEDFADITPTLEKHKEFIRRASKAGCILSTGTDYVLLTVLPGYSLWREMEIFSEAGLSNMEVLRASTYNGIYALGMTDQLGSVEAGKLADFVILDANPLEKISNTQKVHRVVKGGVVYEPEALLKRLVGTIE